MITAILGTLLALCFIIQFFLALRTETQRLRLLELEGELDEILRQIATLEGALSIPGQLDELGQKVSKVKDKGSTRTMWGE